MLTKSQHVPYNVRNILVKIIYVCSNTLEGLCVEERIRGYLAYFIVFSSFYLLAGFVFFFSDLIVGQLYESVRGDEDRERFETNGRRIRRTDSCKIETSCDRSTGTNERTAKNENCGAETRI